MLAYIQNDLRRSATRLALRNMYQEILFLFRGIEAYRLVENSCDDCHFRRSKAIRRKKKKEGTLTRMKNAKIEFEKCIKNCGILDSVEELQNTKNINE